MVVVGVDCGYFGGDMCNVGRVEYVVEWDVVGV